MQQQRRSPLPLCLQLLALAVALLVTTSAPSASSPRPFSLLSVHGVDVVLTSGASAIESSFPSSSLGDAAAALEGAGYPASRAVPLKASVISVSARIMDEAVAAFQATSPTFQANFENAATNTVIKNSFFVKGGFDFAVSTSGPSASDYRNMPTLTYYPLHGNAAVPVYNLPATVSNGQTLALTGPALCRIFRGNITRWNDAAIAATNPDMLLTNTPIVVMLLSTSAAIQLAFTTYCGKIDPEFKALIPARSTPTFPASLNSLSYDAIDLLNSAVSDVPYSIGMTSLSNAATISLPVGSMVNSKGEAVQPSYNGIVLTLYELATDGFPTGVVTLDLTNPSTAQAWPIVFMSYLFVDRTGALTTCSNKKLMLQFLLFFYSSPVVSAIGQSLRMAPFPGVLVSTLRLAERLETELTCLEQPMYSSSSKKGIAAINPLAASVVDLFSNFYSSVDLTVRYSQQALDESLAVSRVAMGENALALVNVAALTDDDVSLIAAGNVALLPAYHVGIVPIFNLPLVLTQFAALPSTADLDLPALYPLRIDLELAARIFIGDVISWLDPELVEHNPQLPVWSAAAGASEADMRMRLVVGATSPQDAISGAKLLFQQLRRSDTAAANPWAFRIPAVRAGPSSNPFLAIIARQKLEPLSRANITLVDVESRLEFKTAMTPGAVSYRPMRARADQTVDFQFVNHNHHAGLVNVSQLALVDSGADSLETCGTRFIEPEGYEDWDTEATAAHLAMLRLPATQRGWIDATNPGTQCWPLSTLLSFAVKTSYSSLATPEACTQGLHALEFIKYLQTTTILREPAESLGLIPLGENLPIRQLTDQVLHGATCDDSVLLVISPKYWSPNSAIAAFGQAMGGLGLALVSVSMAVVVLYRHKVVIRSASVPFLLVILVGMGLLLAAMIPWAEEATHSSCSAFLWLVNLGFMLLFCPLFAKTWRVYRIFSGSHLKVVKISNHKLLAAVAAVVLLDIVLVAVWQGVAPLVPVQYDKLVGNEPHVFTHCSVESSGAGLVFVALVGVEKAGLLLFGAVMAFSTRNVKGTFNESTAISWSIYNTLLSALIGVAIIVFVRAIEDALVLLVLILISWIALSAWGLIFGPKFHLLTQSDEKVIEASRSHITQEKSNGFSFASLAAMTTGQVKHYYQALRLQVNKAERMLDIPLTLWSPTATTKLPMTTEQALEEEALASPTGGGGGTHSRAVSTNAAPRSGLGLHHCGGGSGERVPGRGSGSAHIDPVYAAAADMILAPAKDPDAERERTVLSAGTSKALPPSKASPPSATGSIASKSVLRSPSSGVSVISQRHVAFGSPQAGARASTPTQTTPLLSPSSLQGHRTLASGFTGSSTQGTHHHHHLNTHGSSYLNLPGSGSGGVGGGGDMSVTAPPRLDSSANVDNVLLSARGHRNVGQHRSFDMADPVVSPPPVPSAVSGSATAPGSITLPAAALLQSSSSGGGSGSLSREVSANNMQLGASAAAEAASASDAEDQPDSPGLSGGAPFGSAFSRARARASGSNQASLSGTVSGVAPAPLVCGSSPTQQLQQQPVGGGAAAATAGSSSSSSSATGAAASSSPTTLNPSARPSPSLIVGSSATKPSSRVPNAGRATPEV